MSQRYSERARANGPDEANTGPYPGQSAGPSGGAELSASSADQGTLAEALADQAPSSEPKVHYHAGWNTPGCLPEVPYQRFDDETSALRYLSDEIERQWDQAYDSAPSGSDLDRVQAVAEIDSRFLDAHTSIHGGWVPVALDGYVYDVLPCTDSACEGGES